MNSLLIYLIVYPLASTIFFHLGLSRRSAYRLLLGTTTIAVFACVFMAALAVPGNPFLYFSGGWDQEVGILLVVDQLEILLALLIQIVALVVIWYSKAIAVDRPHLYLSLLCLFITGVNGMVFTGDLFNLFVFLELASLASYALLAYSRRGESLEGVFKYVLLSFSASLLVFLAVGLVYSATGSLNLNLAAAAVDTIPPGLKSAITALLLTGFGLKAGIFPFHPWKADAYGAAMAPVSALMAGITDKVSIFALWSILSTFYSWSELTVYVGPPLLLMGGATVIVGHVLAFRQVHLQRLLAYSSIAHVGYIVIGLASFTPLGTAGALFHMINHSLIKSGMFLAAPFMTADDTLDDLQGLYYKQPAMCGAFFVFSLSLAGFPPFSGFLSKVMIVLGTMEQQHYLPAICIILGSLLAVAYYAPILQRMFTKPSSERAPLVGRPQTRAVVALAATTVALFFGATLVLPWLFQALTQWQY